MKRLFIAIILLSLPVFAQAPSKAFDVRNGNNIVDNAVVQPFATYIVYQDLAKKNDVINALCDLGNYDALDSSTRPSRQNFAKKEACPVGAADDPRPSAVKLCGATERRERNGDGPGLPCVFRLTRLYRFGFAGWRESLCAPRDSLLKCRPQNGHRYKIMTDTCFIVAHHASIPPARFPTDAASDRAGPFPRTVARREKD